MRTAIGLIAGPESPAVTLAIRGLRVLTSIDMAMKVFTSEMASAPASWATCAIWPMRLSQRSGDYFIERPGIAAELDAAVRGVGAGNIQLVSGNALAFVQDFQSMFVVFTGVAENIGDDHDVFDGAEFGKLVVHEGAGADVLQADGVQHSGGGFIQARRRVADQGLARKAFDHESAQPLQVDDVFKFHAVAEGAAGGEDRVLQRDSGETDAEIGGHAAGALVVF